MKKYIYLLICILFSATAYGEVVDVFSPKKETPPASILNTLSKPEQFYTGNDLTRIPGSFEVAVGELLYLKGIVTDAFGIPIEGATIRIWQTNAAGKYQTLLKSDSEYIDKNFIGSGSARTDNLGRYGFKTIFPGVIDGRAPHINMIISHRNFQTIETEIYFENHKLNNKDAQYLLYSNEDRKFLTAKVVNTDYSDSSMGKTATFNIIMDGIHAYKTYR